jgi:hypothetical protein
MIEKVLADDALRERLVAEASEHILSFDWADVARRTGEVHDELVSARLVSRRCSRAPRCPRRAPPRRELVSRRCSRAP